MADGGILDNQPFTTALKRMVSMPVDGPWDRRLVYVVPSVRADPDDDSPVTLRDVLVKSGDLPRSLPLVNSLESLRGAQRAARKALIVHRQTRRFVRSQDDPRALYEAAKALYPMYRAIRIDEYRETIESWLDSPTSADDGAEGGFEALPREEVPHRYGALTISTDDLQMFRLPELYDEARAAWRAPDDSWTWSLSQAERLGRSALVLVSSDDDSPPAALARQAASTLITLARAAKKTRRGIFNQTLADHDVGQAMLGGSAAAIFSGSHRELGERRLLPAWVGDGGFLDGTATEDDTFLPALDAAIHRLVVALAAVLNFDATSTLGAAVLNFDATSTLGLLFDLEVTRGFDSADDQPPPVFGLAVFDAQGRSVLRNGRGEGVGSDPPPARLAGSQLRNFGAFIKRGDRAHDWMWGRLDGSRHIVRTLLTGLGDDDLAERPLHREILRTELPALGAAITSDVDAGFSERGEMPRWWNAHREDVASGDDDRLAAALMRLSREEPILAEEAGPKGGELVELISDSARRVLASEQGGLGDGLRRLLRGRSGAIVGAVLPYALGAVIGYKPALTADDILDESEEEAFTPGG